MRPSPKKLPAVPTGFECFDLLWSQLIPDAADYLAILPRSADPKWATAQGLRFVAISLFKRWAASDELQRTSTRSPLHRLRERNLRLLETQYQGQTLTLVAALVDEARKQYPKASSAQLLTLARDGFKELVSKAFSTESSHTNAYEDEP